MHEFLGNEKEERRKKKHHCSLTRPSPLTRVTPLEKG
jgi:hypothetical protein